MNQVLVAEKKKQTVLDGRFFKSLGMSNKKGPDGKGMKNVVVNNSHLKQPSASVFTDRILS